MELSAADLQYFQRGERGNPKFWSRFGGRPPLAGKRVLDVGCGHGSLCVDTAKAGAAQVVGLDLNAKLIDFAQANVQQNYPELTSTLSFHHLNLSDYPLESFDIIVSKDSFEHIIDLAGMLAEMGKRLVPGGRVYAGFGPLYNSPFGDHGMAYSRIPWAHVFLGKKRFAERVNRRWTHEVNSIYDLGLNGLSFADYRRIFHDSDLDIVYFETNCSTKTISKVFSVLRKAPFLTEYCTHNIYCILERPPSA